MPKLEDVAIKREEKKFTKKSYRPWDLAGNTPEKNIDIIKNLNNEERENENLTQFAHQENSPENSPEKLEKIIEINTFNIIRWEHKDRPENELGEIDDLARTFKEVGQQQPCIVRYSKNKNKYDLIVGERRWYAAKSLGIPLKVIIKDIDDKTAALIQAIENEKRSDLSEYAKGMSYANKIEKGILTQKDLTKILGISKQQVTRLLSYKRIPQKLFDEIQDFRNVSARTAEELARLSLKGDIYVDTLIELAPIIRTGKCGHNRINKEVEKKIEKHNINKETKTKVINNDGRHLFTWRLDNNAIPSIHFPKDIIELIKSNVLSLEELTEEFKVCIASKLSKLSNESPRGD